MQQQQRYANFREGTPEGDALIEWWEHLKEDDKGGRAELRRADSLAKVPFIPAYQDLYHQVRDHVPTNREKLAAVAALAAHVKDDYTSHPVARQMATPVPPSENARVSGLRFRRILQIEDLPMLHTTLLRVIRLLDGQVNLRDLANSVYWWNEETKRRWAFTYYEHAPRDEN